LGRITFEALDFGIPFIGFDSGGIGEIAKILDLQDQMVRFNIGWEKDMFDKVNSLSKNSDISMKYATARIKLSEQFRPEKYCQILESFIL
jgi:hypothetical protein